MRQTILFFPASIRSHVIPALYLAGLVADQYEIHFAVSNEAIKLLVEKQGYKACVVGDVRISVGMEESYSFEKTGRGGLISIIKSLIRNEIYDKRVNDLSEIVDRISPKAIFIDIFISTEIMALFPKYKGIEFIFINPMLSTYRVDGYPAVMEDFWPIREISEKTPEKIRIPIREYIFHFSDQVKRWVYKKHFQMLIKHTGLADQHPVVMNGTHALLFENFPECVMAPLELEFSEEVKRPSQHYFGLCVSENRQEIELDPAFNIQYFRDLKSAGERIIYCAFGTYFEGNYQPFLIFLHKLVEAIATIKEVQLIIATSDFVKDTLAHQRPLPANVKLFSRVPQLDVLKISDLHITHGGLGSIKESILFDVPMLVFPLEPKWDNNGNGLKIDFHGLGMRGSFHHERMHDIRKKIELILDDPKMKQRVKDFRQNVQQANTRENLQLKLLSLIHARSIRAHEYLEQTQNS